MEKKAFVLLSGGLDSTTCLYQAIFDYAGDNKEDVFRRIDRSHEEPGFDPITWVEAVSVDYGQRHVKEAEYAKHTCDRLGIRHSVLNLRDILGGAMLTDKSIDVPDIKYDDIKGVSPTYVPFRNGTLLSLITAHAQKYVNSQVAAEAVRLKREQQATGLWMGDAAQQATANAKDLCGVYFGAHAEDAFNWAYPDCTPEFIGAMSNAIYIGSYMSIRLHTPLMWLKKDQIVKLGGELGVPFEQTWSCYKGEEQHCGACPTCYARKDAFAKAGVEDPTRYAA